MSISSKSPKAILETAWSVAQSALPAYAHRFSPRKFTQPQLFACVVLKQCLRLDYRGLVSLLGDCPELPAAIGMRRLPHYSTVQRAAQRLLAARPARDLLDATVARARRSGVVDERVAVAAVDATGLDVRHRSTYYDQRATKAAAAKRAASAAAAAASAAAPQPKPRPKPARFPMLTVVCDTKSHLVLAAVTGKGPWPEITRLPLAIKRAVRRVGIDRLVADAGYDSEAAHVLCRERFGVEAIIPPLSGKGLRSGHVPKGRYRREMAEAFDSGLYRRRTQIETVNSMLKRNFGTALTARGHVRQRREMLARTLAHNVAII